MKANKKITILYSVRHFNELYNQKYNLLLTLASKIIAFDLDLRLLLQDEGIKYKIPEDYISMDDAVDIEAKALDLANKWYKDLFIYKKISLGDLFWRRIRYYFAWIIQNVQLILNIINIENPSEIVTFMDDDCFVNDFNTILSHICGIKKITVKFLPLLNKQFKYKISIKSLLIKYSYIFLNSFPIRKILRFFSNLLITSFRDKNINKILTIGSYTFPSLIGGLSENNIVFDLNENRAFTFIRLIKKNLINIIRRRRICFYLCLEDYRTKKIKKRSSLFVDYNIKRWGKMLNLKSFKQQFVYKDIILWDFINKEIKDILTTDFKHVAENINIFYDLLKKYNFKLIAFSADTPELPKTLVRVASILNIQTLIILHGIAGYYENFYAKMKVEGHTSVFTDKIAVWGKYDKDFYIRFGVPKEKIIITGCPRFDVYDALNSDKKLRMKIKNKVYRHFGINKNKKMILYTAGSPATYTSLTAYHNLSLLEVENSYKFILNAINQLPNSHLIIKRHPGENIDHILRLLIKKSGIKNVSVVSKYNIANLLVACDCQITITSTTGLEGILLGKPLIYINSKFRNEMYINQYQGVASEVMDEEELLATIKRCLRIPDLLKYRYKHFIECYNYKNDGLATKRVVKLINKTINS